MSISVFSPTEPPKPVSRHEWIGELNHEGKSILSPLDKPVAGYFLMRKSERGGSDERFTDSFHIEGFSEGRRNQAESGFTHEDGKYFNRRSLFIFPEADQPFLHMLAVLQVMETTDGGRTFAPKSGLSIVSRLIGELIEKRFAEKYGDTAQPSIARLELLRGACIAIHLHSGPLEKSLEAIALGMPRAPLEKAPHRNACVTRLYELLLGACEQINTLDPALLEPE